MVGLTEVLEPATAPTPWSMETEVAPVKFQARTDDPPAVMFEGEAVKEPITGTGNADTVTVTLAVALPEEFVAVSVYVVDVYGVTEMLEPLTMPTL